MRVNAQPSVAGFLPTVRIILSFCIIPLLRPGGRNKGVKEVILLDQLRGRQQVGNPKSSCSLHFSSFLQKLMRLLCHMEATLQSS